MASDYPARILIVEDDEGIGAGLVRAVATADHSAVWCRTGSAARAVDLADIDLVVLDLGLPDGDGLDLCREVRTAQPALPILILTARNTETDVVVGLDAGADDYLVKPFRLAELLARLRALLRRRTVGAAPGTLAVGDITIDTAARRVWLDGRETDLRPKEFDLLTLLMRNAGKVVTREHVMEHVWDEHWFGSTKTLDVTLASLRQRLGEPGPDHSRITTLRGVGYRFEREVEPPQ